MNELINALLLNRIYRINGETNTFFVKIRIQRINSVTNYEGV